jgi:hypothetical protein
MAKGASGKKLRMNNPMTYKSGKARLGPLNVAQLEKMLATVSKPKDKAKIQRALSARMLTQAVSTKTVAETQAEAV